MVWVFITDPARLLVVTVITCEPGIFQAKLTVSVRPAVWVMGARPLACQV